MDRWIWFLTLTSLTCVWIFGGAYSLWSAAIGSASHARDVAAQRTVDDIVSDLRSESGRIADRLMVLRKDTSATDTSFLAAVQARKEKGCDSGAVMLINHQSSNIK